MSTKIQISREDILQLFNKYYRNLLQGAKIVDIQELSGGYVEKIYKIVIQQTNDVQTKTKEEFAYVFKTYMFGDGFPYDKERKLYLINKSIGASLIFKKYVTSKAIVPLLSDNKKYLEDLGDMFIAVFPYVPHKKIVREKMPLKVHKDVVTFLAHMHNKYVKNKPQVDKMAQKLRIEVPTIAMYDKLNKQLQKRVELGPEILPKLQQINSNVANIYVEGNKYAKKFLQEYRKILSFVPTRYLSHRDFTANNILFNKNWSIVGLVDFDRAKYMNFYRELWFYVFYSIIAPRQLDFEKSAEIVRRMIQVYLRTVNFDVDKTKFLQGALIELVYWFTKSWSFEEYVKAPSKFEDLMQRTIYMHKHFWDMREVVEEVVGEV